MPSSPSTNPPNASDGTTAGAAVAAPSTRQEELRSFLFFTVVMAPVLAVMLVAAYGFAVWMYQLIAGPPAG